MRFLALLVLFGLVGAGCDSVCAYCAPGTYPADPRAACSPCVRPDGGGVPVGRDAGDAPADRTDVSADAHAEAGQEAPAPADADVGADADADDANAEAGQGDASPEAGQGDAGADGDPDGGADAPATQG